MTDDWHYYYILGIPFGSRLGRGRQDGTNPVGNPKRPSDLRDSFLRDDEHFLGSRGFVAPVEEEVVAAATGAGTGPSVVDTYAKRLMKLLVDEEAKEPIDGPETSNVI